jgi:hypothetical protein
MSDSAAYTLSAAALLRDFEATADRMRGDLRAAGWREGSRVSPERWTSPDRRRSLGLAAAWELAHRDALREATDTPRALRIEREGYDQRADDHAGEG